MKRCLCEFRKVENHRKNGLFLDLFLISKSQKVEKCTFLSVSLFTVRLFEFLPDAFPAEHAQLFFPAWEFSGSISLTFGVAVWVLSVMNIRVNQKSRSQPWLQRQGNFNCFSNNCTSNGWTLSKYREQTKRISLETASLFGPFSSPHGWYFSVSRPSTKPTATDHRLQPSLHLELNHLPLHPKSVLTSNS